MSGREKVSKSKRGRPRSIEPQEVAVVALQLFEQEGYEGVTMEQIAEKASVSRRTLFRLFPSKVDLLWGGAEEILDVVKERVKALPSGKMTLKEFVYDLLMPALGRLDEPWLASLARRRLRLIMASPALLDHAALHEMRLFLADLIRSRVSPQKAPPELLAGSIASVAFAAILWWAQLDESPMSVQEAFISAFSSLAEVSSLAQEADVSA